MTTLSRWPSAMGTECFSQRKSPATMSSPPDPDPSRQPCAAGKPKPTQMKSSPKLGIVTLAIGLALIKAGAPAAEPESESFKKYGQEFKGKIGRSYAESEEWYPEGAKPKPGTPNVLMILLDDVG